MSEIKNEVVERKKIKTIYKNGSLEYLFDDNYSYEQEKSPLLPCGYFWSYLSKANHGPKMWVPDTFVLGPPSMPGVWIYTNDNGVVEKTTFKSLNEIATKMCDNQDDGIMVAICKKSVYKGDNIVGNDIKVIRNYGSNSFTSQMPTNLSGQCVIQKFIKCSGQKAFICRTVWRNKGVSQSFLITNHRSYNDDPNIPENQRYSVKSNYKSSVVRVTYGKQIQETSTYIESMVKFFQTQHGIYFSEVMADFIKDQNNRWWLTNIKGFHIESIKKILKILSNANTVENTYSDENEKEKKQKYQKTKICKYCQKPYLQSHLKYKMTLKMMILTDRYMLHRGKTFKWLQRSDINNIELHSMYQQHRVCERCYKLYTYTKQLMDIEVKYAEKMGISLTEESKYSMVMNVGSKYLEQSSKNRQVSKLQTSLPAQLQLGPYSKLIIQNNKPIKNKEIIKQMIRYRFIINLVEIDEIVKVDPNLTYYLQYSLINIKVKYKLEINPNDKAISLNKLRVVYAFSHDRKTLNQFIDDQKSLSISIVCENEKKERFTWGKTELSLAEFMSDKIIKREYYKMFNLKDVVWGWGLTANIGVSSSNGYVDTSRTIFKKYRDLIYYPENQDYFACEPLHQEWISMIKQQKINRRQNKVISSGVNDIVDIMQQDDGFSNQQNMSCTMPNINSQIEQYMNRKKKKRRTRVI